MSRYSPRVFDKNLPVYVRRSIKISGKLHLPGQLFDWKHCQVTDRQVRNMFNTGYLQHSFHEDIEIKNDPDIIDDKEDNEDYETTEDDEQSCVTYRVEHKSGPWYSVFGPDGEVKTEKSLKKIDAMALVEKLTDAENGDADTI